MDRLLNRLYLICNQEGFPDMEIEFSGAGSMAWIKGPKIKTPKIEICKSCLMPPEDYMGDYVLAMFLHELAHHLYHRETNGERHGHDGRMLDIFTGLVAKYMIHYYDGKSA